MADLSYKDKLKLYDDAVNLCPRFDRKGKSMPYTSANGHMFSLLNKDAQIGVRFSKVDQERLIQELGTDYFRSYGSVMRGYVLMPESIWQDVPLLAKYLKAGYEYVMSLEPK